MNLSDLGSGGGIFVSMGREGPRGWPGLGAGLQVREVITVFLTRGLAGGGFSCFRESIDIGRESLSGSNFRLIPSKEALSSASLNHGVRSGMGVNAGLQSVHR